MSIHRSSARSKVSYHGVLANNAPLRAAVTTHAGLLWRDPRRGRAGVCPSTKARGDRNIPLALNVIGRRCCSPASTMSSPLLCPRCGETVRIIAFITDVGSIQRILEHIGQPTSAPRIAPPPAMPPGPAQTPSSRPSREPPTHRPPSDSPDCRTIGTFESDLQKRRSLSVNGDGHGKHGRRGPIGHTSCWEHRLCLGGAFGEKVTEISFAIVVSPSSRSIAKEWLAVQTSDASEETVIVMPIWPDLARSEACRRLTRNLSPSEG